MRCGNYLCIYEEKGECILNDIELDITGQCTECIYLKLKDETMRKAKEETMKEYS